MDVPQMHRRAVIGTDVVLLKANEVATLLGISRSQAYMLMAKGGLPVVRIGRSVRVPQAALAAWIRQNTESAGERSERR